MKNILVPIDLSAFSNEIIMSAVNFAKEVNGEITLLHVVSMDAGFIVGDMGYHYLPELEETILHEDAKTLQKMENKVKEMGIEVKTLIKQGIPKDVILDLAEELKIDTIIIGSKGHNSLYEAFVGSVCREVIKNSKIPIYVIPSSK